MNALIVMTHLLFSVFASQLRYWLCLLMVMGSASTFANLSEDGHSVLQSVSWTSDQTSGEIMLSADMVIILSDPMMSALQQGVPVYFVAQAQLTRKRLWLLNMHDVDTKRFWRLSYQPITRAWRLQTSQVSSEHTDLAQGIAQHFNSLDEALQVMQRIRRWSVGSTSALQADAAYQATFSFGVDRQRLPRPLQFDSLERSDWDIQLLTQQPLLLSEQSL